MTVDEPQHLVVRQNVFAGDRFWTALDRLADRQGHDGHQLYLVGEIDPTNRYRLQCATCDRSVATMLVEREQPTASV